MKKILTYIFVLLVCNVSVAQSLLSSMGSGLAETSDKDVFTTVRGAQSTIDVTGVNKVLAIASFQINMNSSGSDYRNATLRIVDINNENTSSGSFIRSLTDDNNTDYGNGSIVYIFDVSDQTGLQTFALQHMFDTQSRKLTTQGTLVLIALKDDNFHLKNEQVQITTPVEITENWLTIENSTTETILTNSIGGFYVAASIEANAKKLSNNEIKGEWKLQYKKNDEAWTDLTYEISRSFSSIKDYGLISLVATLPNETEAANYQFRAMHRYVNQNKAALEVYTNKINLAAISLATDFGYYPVFKASGSGINTINDTLSEALSMEITPSDNVQLFLHAQYSMSATGSVSPAKHDLYIDNNMLNSDDNFRHIANDEDNGSGVLIGLSNTLQKNILYNLSLRHASENNNILFTNNMSLHGFGLSLNSDPLPIELLDFNALCGQDGGVDIHWSTSSEVNNDFFTLYRSTDDGKTYKPIAEIKGSGNSNKIKTYNYHDEEPTVHDTYYKLKQTDFDGKSKEYDIVVIYCKFNHKKITVYPNPISEVLNFSFYNDYHIEDVLTFTLYNAAGKVSYIYELYSTKDENQHTLRIPQMLKNGVYFLQVKLGSEYFYTQQILIKR